MSEKDNVIAFKQKETVNLTIIDTKKRVDDINNALDHLWETLNSNHKLKEIYSDNEGKIHYSTEHDDSDNERYALKSHLYFMTEFINNNFLAEKFATEYEEYLVYSGWNRLIKTKNLSS